MTPVAPAVPIDPQSWPYRDIPPCEILWRYMSMSKFESLLTTSSLYFCRQDLFPDPFEGKLFLGDSSELSDADRAFYAAYQLDETPEKLKEQFEIHRTCVFASCWHRNTKESGRMWLAYTPDPNSVVITTSRKAFDRWGLQDIMKSTVRYHGPNFRRSHVFGWNAPSFCKPMQYSFEREFRLLRNLEEDESVEYGNPSDQGRFVKCRIRRIIHRVITHPDATPAFKKEVEHLMKHYLWTIRREDSALPAQRQGVAI